MKLGDNSKIDLIKGVPLFADASKGELAEIAAIADEVDLPAGKTLIKEGDIGREFFILIDGDGGRHAGRQEDREDDGPGRLLRRDRAGLEGAAHGDGHDHLPGARARDHRPRVPAAARALADRSRSPC